MKQNVCKTNPAYEEHYLGLLSGKVEGVFSDESPSLDFAHEESDPAHEETDHSKWVAMCRTYLKFLNNQINKFVASKNGAHQQAKGTTAGVNKVLAK